MAENQVILVNEQDAPIGVMEKMEAHKTGTLHRAFSIFIFNSQGEMLLQQRAKGKYHSGGLWTNACCSHPQPGEQVEKAAERRLMEELGFSTSLEKVFDFLYKAGLDNGLTEHEFDHVFVGEYNGAINFNTEEVANVSFQKMNEIKSSLQEDPSRFTAWFHHAFPGIEKWWELNYNNK